MACSARIRALLALSTLAVAFAAPSAAVDWPPIAPDELAMTSVPQQPGAPAVILYREENADDLQNFQSLQMRIKVLSDAGRRYADVEIPYNRRTFSVSEVSGRTVRADGSVVPFDGKVFDKVLLKGHGLRFHVKSFTLPDVQVGSIIEYRYNLRYDDHTVVAPQWLVQNELFQKRARFKFTPFQNHGSVEILLAHGQASRGLAWTPYLPKEHLPVLHQTPALFWVDLDINDVPPFIEEPHMPPASLLKWRVNLYYQPNSNEADYWKDEFKYWNKDMESFLGRDNAVAATVARLVTPSDAPEQKLRKIYAFVAGLRNWSYEPARETAEDKALGTKANVGAEDVLRQKGGSHDDLNLLFASMARAAGARAQMMALPDQTQNLFDPHYLSTDQLDALVVVVPLDGKDTFFDPGTRFCPYGLLSWKYAGMNGLRQGATEGPHAESAASATYQDAVTQRMTHLQMDEQGAVAGTMAVSFSGIEAMTRRQEGGKTDAEGRKKLIEDEVRSWLPGGSEVALTNTPDWDGIEKPLIAQLKISSTLGIRAGKRWMLPVHLFEVNRKPLFPGASRVHPLYFEHPYREVDEVHIALPAVLEIETLPTDGTEKLDFAMYTSKYKKESQNSVLSVRDLGMNGVFVEPGEYKDVKGFFDKVKAADDQPVVLKAAAGKDISELSARNP